MFCLWNGTYNDYLVFYLKHIYKNHTEIILFQNLLLELHADLECTDCHEHSFFCNKTNKRSVLVNHVRNR